MAGKITASMFSVFRNRSFIFLWIGQLISSMGALAASILAYRITARDGHGSGITARAAHQST